MVCAPVTLLSSYAPMWPGRHSGLNGTKAVMSGPATMSLASANTAATALLILVFSRTLRRGPRCRESSRDGASKAARCATATARAPPIARRGPPARRLHATGRGRSAATAGPRTGFHRRHRRSGRAAEQADAERVDQRPAGRLGTGRESFRGRAEHRRRAERVQRRDGGRDGEERRAVPRGVQSSEGRHRCRALLGARRQNSRASPAEVRQQPFDRRHRAWPRRGRPPQEGQARAEMERHQGLGHHAGRDRE